MQLKIKTPEGRLLTNIKSIVYKTAYIFALLLLSTLCLSAQVPMQQMRGLTRAQIDSMVHPTVSSQAAEVVKFDCTSYELGTLQEDDAPVSRTFTLHNVSKSPISIARVRTTCGCTVAEYDTLRIAPDATGQITLTYNPKNRPGTIDVDAFVYLEGHGKQPMARLSLYGDVVDKDAWNHLPYTMGTLRIKRKEVALTELPRQGRPSVRIPCANSGENTLHLSSRLLPAYASFRTEPAEILPGAEADIIVTIDVAKLPTSEQKIQFPLLIEGIGGKPSARTIHVTIDKTK